MRTNGRASFGVCSPSSEPGYDDTLADVHFSPGMVGCAYHACKTAQIHYSSEHAPRIPLSQVELILKYKSRLLGIHYWLLNRTDTRLNRLFLRCVDNGCNSINQTPASLANICPAFAHNLLLSTDPVSTQYNTLCVSENDNARAELRPVLTVDQGPLRLSKL